jgi:hypothetical protein
MSGWIREILYDVNFVRGHTLQPAWFKAAKIFLLLGVLAGFLLLFGLRRTLVFAGAFLLLSLILHLVYRSRTRKFTSSWMDFRVEEKDGRLVYQRIGALYYSLVAGNAVLALLLCLWLG